MAVRHILSQTGLQQMHQGVLWASSVSLQKNLFSVLRSSSDESDRPDERQVSRKVSRFVIKHSSLTGRTLHINCEHQTTLMLSSDCSLFCSKHPRTTKHKRPGTSARFFGDGVKAVVGTAAQVRF